MDKFLSPPPPPPIFCRSSKKNTPKKKVLFASTASGVSHPRLLVLSGARSNATLLQGHCPLGTRKQEGQGESAQGFTNGLARIALGEASLLLLACSLSFSSLSLFSYSLGRSLQSD